LRYSGLFAWKAFVIRCREKIGPDFEIAKW
jgi:hypothetical protein